MAKDVSVLNFTDELMDIIREYTEDVSAGVDEETKSTADKVLKEVRKTAPRSDSATRGEYAKSFVKTDKSFPGNRRYVVWNKKHYQRVHLLELGHAKVKGDRVNAYPHLVPAHEKYAPQMVKNIKGIIQNGGRK